MAAKPVLEFSAATKESDGTEIDPAVVEFRENLGDPIGSRELSALFRGHFEDSEADRCSGDAHHRAWFLPESRCRQCVAGSGREARITGIT